MSEYRDQLIAAMQAIAVRPTGKKGRPRKESAADVADYLHVVAVAVWRRALADGTRGAQSRAIVAVARTLRDERPLPQKVAWVKKAVQRRPLARTYARIEARNLDLVREFQRRTAGLPADVVERLRGCGARALIALLREAGIDGTAPAAFVAAVRASDFLSPN